MTILGTKLKEFRSKKNFSQQEVADQLNIKQSTYSNWEKGTTSPSAEYFPQLVEIFDTPIQEFFPSTSQAVSGTQEGDHAIMGFDINLNPEILEKILIPLNALVNNLSNQERAQYENTIKNQQQTIETQNSIITKFLEVLEQKQ